MTTDHEALEQKIAKIQHSQWSGWMEYLFSKCRFDAATGVVTIPQWAVERWDKQAKTPYDQLTDKEQESDLEEAKRIIELIESETAKAYAKGFNEGTLNPNKWLCPICKVILKSRVRELHESTHREGDAKEKP